MGHYLMDQIYGAGVVCSVPEARGGKGKGLMGGAPLFRASAISRRSPTSFCAATHSMSPAAPGQLGRGTLRRLARSCEQKMEEYHGSAFHMTIMGEVLGRKENHVRINPAKVDAWGIPVLHVETKYTDNEFNMAKDAVDAATEVVRGGRIRSAVKERCAEPAGIQHS